LVCGKSRRSKKAVAWQLPVVGLEKRASLSLFDGPNRRRGTVWGDEGKAAGCLVADGFAVFAGL